MEYKSNNPSFPEIKFDKAGSPDICDYRMIVEEILGPRLKVEYEVVCASYDIIAAECRITDTVSGTSVVRVGECGAGETEHPVATAYERAFAEAAQALLRIDTESADSTPVVDVEPLDKTLFSDDEVLLIGNMKGYTFGEMKDKPEFAHFLEQLVGAGGLHFPDQARTEQLAKLLQYAEEVHNNAE